MDAIAAVGHAGDAPKLETSTSVAEVVFGLPLRIPGLCFQSEQSRPSTVEEQLSLARANVANFSPQTLDLRRFKSSPFIAKSLRTASYVYVRDDRLGKSSLASRVHGALQGH